MDAETRAYLGAMQETLIRRMEQLTAETRAHAEQLTAKTVAHAEQLSVEAVAHAERLHAEAVAYAEQLNAKTLAHAERLHAEARADAERLNVDTRRELGTMIEALDGNVRLVAEGVVGLQEGFARFAESTERRLARLEAHLP